MSMLLAQLLRIDQIPLAYIPSERVKGIWPDRVETDLTPEEAGNLPSYDEPKVTTWHADEGGGFGARLRRAGKDLFGRRR